MAFPGSASQASNSEAAVRAARELGHIQPAIATPYFPRRFHPPGETMTLSFEDNDIVLPKNEQRKSAIL